MAEKKQDSNFIDQGINQYLNILEKEANNNCKLCSNLFDCTQYYVTSNLDFDINSWIEPDSSIFDNVNKENLLAFEESLKTIANTTIEQETGVVDENVKKDVLDVTLNNNVLGGFIDSPFKAPKNLLNVLQKCDIFDSPLPSIPFTQIELKTKQTDEHNLSLSMKEFNKLEFTQLKQNNDGRDSLFSFFSITALEDIFENSSQSTNNKSDNTILYSYEDDIEQELSSPILSFHKNRNVRSAEVDCASHGKENERISDEDSDGIVDTSISFLRFTSKKCSKEQAFDVTDIADLSAFGLNNSVTHFTSPPQVLNNNSSKPDDPNISYKTNSFCEDSLAEMCGDSFSEKIIKNERNSSKLQNTRTEVSLTKSNTNKTDDSKQWEKNIWSFCIDSNSFIGDVPNITGPTIVDNCAKDIIDLTSDNSLSSPNKSPSLIKTQRFNTQKSPFINNRLNFEDDLIDDPAPSNPENAHLKIFTKNPLLTLRKTSPAANNHKSHCGESSVTQPCVFSAKEPFNTTKTNDSVYEKLSPVLSRHEVTNGTFSSKKSIPKKLEFSDDDDDFDCKKDNVPWINPKKFKLQEKKLSTYESKEQVQKKHRKHMPEECIYIDLEADVLESDSETEEEGCLDGSFDKSFVDDNTEAFLNTTAVHARYLESVKDTNRGQFKIPQRSAPNIDVYSQVENVQDNTYLNDTFCVHSQEPEPDYVEDLSELEVAELILEEKRKNKRTKKQIPLKRRRVLECSSSDSDQL